MNLLVLARLTGEVSYQVRAEAVLGAWGDRLRRQPRVAPFMLAALATSLLPAAEVAIVEATTRRAARPLRDAVDARFLPSTVVVPVHAGITPARWPTPCRGSGRSSAATARRPRTCVATSSASSRRAIQRCWLRRSTGCVHRPCVEPVE